MRYVLLDRITELEPGKAARGVKCVTLTDEVLHDHFPDYPVLPGVLLVEAAAQLAGFLLEMSTNLPDEPPRRAILVQITRAKFYRPAGPGDAVELYAQLERTLDDAGQLVVGADISGDRAMRASLTFMLKELDSERVHEQRRYLYRLWTKDLGLWRGRDRRRGGLYGPGRDPPHHKPAPARSGVRSRLRGSPSPPVPAAARVKDLLRLRRPQRRHRAEPPGHRRLSVPPGDRSDEHSRSNSR